MISVRAELMSAAAVACAYLLVFAAGEAVRRAFPSLPELARKTVHLLGGLVALALPFVIRSHWTVLVLAAGMIGIIELTRRMGGLRSVHGVGRESHGAVYFPVSVYLVFLLAHDRPVLYLVSILVMTVADTFAALVGERYGAITFDVEGNRKSLEGSLAFFFVTFLCVHLSLLLLTPIGRPESVLTALVIALLVTGFEAISTAGSDNIFVPFGTYYILAKMTGHSLAEAATQLFILLFLIALTALISVRQRIFRTSGLIGMILLNYAAWSLCDVYWFLPLLLAQVFLYVLVSYFSSRVAEEIKRYQIKVLFYSALVPAVLIFVANTVENYREIFLPYLTSVVGQITIISFYFLTRVVAGTGGFTEKLHDRRYPAGLACSIAATVCIAVLPVVLYADGEELAALALVWGGSLLAVTTFTVLLDRYRVIGEDSLLRQRVRLACVGASAVAVYAVRTLASR